MTRLSPTTLGGLFNDVERPGYERSGLEPAIVHIGPGAFHRAHQASVFDDLARAGDQRSGVVAIGVQSGRSVAALKNQGGLFTLETRAASDTNRRLIGCIIDCIDARTDAGAALDAISSPTTRMVTLTITEKSYADSPAMALLAAGLARRRALGSGGLNLLSCDNLPANGEVLRASVLEAAGTGSPDLADWINARCAFPSSVVDRITPAVTARDIDRAEREIGLRDEALTVSEPFSQWVLEGPLIGEPPDLGRGGVQIVEDLELHARMKLWLLNGAHSALAWLGRLAGMAHVHEVASRPAAAGFLKAFWDEASVALPRGDAKAALAYRELLARRFMNPALPHALAQIAHDSPIKLSVRILPPLALNLVAGRPCPAQLMAVAAFLKSEAGAADASATPIANALTRAGVAVSPELAHTPNLGTGVASALADLSAKGPIGAMAALECH